MEILIQTFYTISNALLIPDMVILLGLVAWVIMEVGGFIHESIARPRSARNWESFLEELQAQPNPPERAVVMRFFESTNYRGFLSIFADRGRDLANSSIHLGKLVTSLDIWADSRISRMLFGVRVGPLLGLMGTLIPLGPLVNKNLNFCLKRCII